jgi:hypothetical protein
MTWQAPKRYCERAGRAVCSNGRAYYDEEREDLPEKRRPMTIPFDFKLTGTNHGYNRGRKQKETRYSPS